MKNITLIAEKLVLYSLIIICLVAISRIALATDPIQYTDKSSIIWVTCKVNYGAKGVYPTLFRVIKYNKTHLWVMSQDSILKESYKNLKLNPIHKYKLEHCKVI